MKVKTYKTGSLEEGIENIKRDLGSEALILSTRSVSVRPRFSLFKRPAWEITAAFEEKSAVEPPVPSTETARKSEEKRNEDNFVVPLSGPSRRILPGGEGRGVATAAAPAPEKSAIVIQKDHRMEELIGELGELKKSLKVLSNGMPARNQNYGGGLFAELVSQGIDEDLADHLITTANRGKPAPSELRERVRRLLADQLIIAPPAELSAKARMVSIFIGPTGVGKTTTIAKIAGHAAIRMKKKAALISTDTFRVGGHEQLTRFGELLGVPSYGCADVSALKDLVASLEDRDLVLIDTPGSSPSDLARLSKLETLISSADAKVHLVVSATTRSEDITKIIMRFQRFSPASLVFTKLDETDAKGPLVGDLLRNEVPVSYLTNGQRVPEDLLIPSADGLAQLVLPQERSI